MAYKVEIYQTAQKQLLSSPKEIQKRIALVIDNLAVTPRPVGCKKLQETGLWHIRVDKYKVVYTIEDDSKVIKVVKVATRCENNNKT